MSTTGASTRIVVMSAGIIRSVWLVENLADSALTNQAVACLFSGAPTVSSFFNSALLNGRFGSTNFAAFTGCEGYSNGAVVTVNAGAISNITSAYPIVALSAHSETAGCKGRAGRFSDLWFGSSSIVTGSTYPTSPDNKQFAQFGPFVMPWNGTSPVLT